MLKSIRFLKSILIGRGDEIGLIFLSKNLCRYSDFFQRYSRLANPLCQTSFLVCSLLIARNLQTQKSHHLWWLFVFVVGATRFEHATSWSQTKRSTRLSYAPLTNVIFTPYFLFCKHFFICFLFSA